MTLRTGPQGANTAQLTVDTDVLATTASSFDGMAEQMVREVNKLRDDLAVMHWNSDSGREFQNNRFPAWHAAITDVFRMLTEIANGIGEGSKLYRWTEDDNLAQVIRSFEV